MSALDEPNLKIKVALGLVPGWRLLRKFGMNDTVAGTSTAEDVWPVTTPRVLPTSAGVVSLVSSSTADDQAAVGTGAWYITVEGLDANYKEITEIVALDGTVTVQTTASFFRINRMYVGNGSSQAAGTGQTNAGNITATIGGATQAYIEAGEGQTHQAMYTIPADTYFALDQYRWTLGRMAGSTDCQVSGQVQLVGTNTWRFISDVTTFGPMFYQNDDGMTLLPPKAELRMQTNSSAATQVTGIFSGYLIKADRFDV